MTTPGKLELGAGPNTFRSIRVFKIAPLDCYYYDRGIRLCNKTGTTSFVRADIDVMRRASGLVGEHVDNV